MHFDFWPSRLPKTQAWRAQEPVFWPVLRWSSMSNAAAGTDKKETIFAASGLTSGLISHLDLALRRTSTSDHLGFPKRSLQNSETAWPGELKKPVFWPVLGWSSVSNVAAGTAKKETICAAAGLIIRRPVLGWSSMSNAAAGTDKKDKASQNAAFKTAQQHGLANSRSSFFDLCWGDLQCQTLRPEPLKKTRFLPLQDLLRASFRTWT